MASRKEDEKNERSIRSLLKLPDNRRCINCNSLGPQYVCTNFWTFICTTCSGIHREFTHRVKSVSMAKFTSQEVSALQGGGNASAKEIYLKEWDAQRHSFPDGSNVEKLRDFIKHVYVDRRYTGERTFDKPPRVKMGDAENSSENRRLDAYHGGSRSPPYEDAYDRRYSDRSSAGGRSPGYDQDRQVGDYRRSPARADVVNDWRRDDRFGNGRRSEDGRSSDGGSKLEFKSPDRQRDLDISSPPMVRPVREILGDNVSPLRVIEPPKVETGRSPDSTVRTMRTASFSSIASSNENPAELKIENSLIDFDAFPEPSIPQGVPQTQQATVAVSGAHPTTSSNSDNWANFDSVPAVKVSQAPPPPKANTLESLLSELAVPASVPGQIAQTPPNVVPQVTPNVVDLFSTNPPVPSVANTTVSPLSAGAPAAPPVTNPATFPFGAAPGPASVLPVNAGGSFVNAANAGQWPTMPAQQHPLFSTAANPSSVQPFSPAVGGAPSNQPWNPLFAQSVTASAPQVSQPVSRPPLEPPFGVGTQPSPAEAKPSGRRELPQDIFTVNYSSMPASVPGWQTGYAYGMRGNMQYNVSAPLPNFSQLSSKSTNPFDISSDPSPVQQPLMFPSMMPLQGALPNIPTQTGLLRTSSLGTPSLSWMTPPQSSHPPSIPPQGHSYASAMPPSSYMGQQLPPNMIARHPSVVGQGLEGAGFGTFNPNQQQSGLYSAPATPNTFSSGNPFG